MSIAKDLLDSIDILAADKVSSVKFDKTVRATIADKVDESIGKYKVKYQNSTFYAYDLNLKGYAKNTKVYVVIPSSDFEKDPYILGPVTKNASSTQTVLNPEDRMSLVGTNVITQSNQVGFASYKSNNAATNSRDLLAEGVVSVDNLAVSTYKEDTEYLLVGATLKTSLDSAQKIGGGNYGIKVVCRYYDPSYKSNEDAAAAGAYVFREYTLNIDRMTGQPFNYVAGSDQYAIFDIDSEHLANIHSVKAFCEDFPNQKTGDSQYNYIDGHFEDDEGNIISFNVNECVYDKITKEWYQCRRNSSGELYYVNITDIVISNIRCEFLDALDEAELQGLALRITTPLGGFFYTQGGIIKPESLQLYADLRVKGKKVNYSEQKVNFYWFAKDARVDNQSKYYQQYGGVGWRCLNDPITGAGTNGTGFAADTYVKIIYASDCLAYENIYKCVALFKQDNETNALSVVTTVLNLTKEDLNNVWIYSSMGNDFTFNEGKTDLACRIDGATPEQLESYKYYWTRSIDGGSEELYLPEDTTRFRNNITINEAHYFITYTCSVYDQEDNLVGTAAVTLNNGEPTGQFRLVLNNGTQVFKYNADGISPASPSVDELDRIDLSTLALSFDIYNDKGQLVNLGEGQEKIRKAKIKWIWPSNSDENPTEQIEGFESMLLPATISNAGQLIPIYTYKEDYLESPSDGTFIKRWIVEDQSQLSYNIQNLYDIEKTNNNIILEVDYQGQHLIATTNFTFTKEGELGTNGTKYTTRITPKSNTYSKIVIGHPDGLYGLTANGNYEKTDNMPFKVQIWDGGINPLKEYQPNDSHLTWSTELDGRNSNQYMTVNNTTDTISFVVSRPITQNHTLKVTVNDSSISSQPFYAIYPLDLLQNLEYNINGGYRSCNYESDGTRSAFTQKPFTLTRIDGEEIDPDIITWTNSWGGRIYTNAIDITTQEPKAEANTTLSGYNTILVEPPAYYIGSNVNNYITCSINGTTVAVIPIEFYLNRYGLAAMNGWDGVSLKLNTQGTNYILAPQMGAGKKESDGSFTGIVAGTSMEGGSTNTGLFGYKSGQRTIFLDANTGNATFGKAGVNQIKIDASGAGSIQGTGMTITLGTNPSINFTTGRFKVDKDGNLTATNANVTGNITATYLTATTGGSIGGWKINPTTLTATSGGNTITLNSNGSLSGPHWSIANNGVATFTDVVITNGNAVAQDKTIISIGNKVGGTGGAFTVNNRGQMTASGVSVTGTITANTLNASSGGKIGGWTIGSSSLSHGNFTLSASGNGQIKFGSGSLSSGGVSNGSHTGSHSGSHSGSGSGFSMGSGAGNSLAGHNLGGNTGHWFDMKYTYFSSTPKLDSWSPSDYYVTIDGTRYTLQGSSWRPQISGWQYYPSKLTVMAGSSQS